MYDFIVWRATLSLHQVFISVFICIFVTLALSFLFYSKFFHFNPTFHFVLDAPDSNFHPKTHSCLTPNITLNKIYITVHWILLLLSQLRSDWLIFPTSFIAPQLLQDGSIKSTNHLEENEFNMHILNIQTQITTPLVKHWKVRHCLWRLIQAASNWQLLSNIKRSDSVAKQYVMNVALTIAFYGKHLKIMFILYKLLSKPQLHHHCCQSEIEVLV